MSTGGDAYYERLIRELEEARAAEIPSIPEIRACEKRHINYLTRLVVEYLRNRQRVPPPPVRLRVIGGGACSAGPARGICSPVKSRDLQAFEALGREIFGSIESCTTAWPAAREQATPPSVAIGTAVPQGS